MEVFTKPKKLTSFDLGPGGTISSARTGRWIFATKLMLLYGCAGPLPKVLPTSLGILNLAGGNTYYGDGGWRYQAPHKSTGGIPPEWGALTNLNQGAEYGLLRTRL